MRPDRTNVRGFPAENRTGLSGNTPSEGPCSGRKGRKRETGRTPQPRAFAAVDRLRRQRRSRSWTKNDSLYGAGNVGTAVPNPAWGFAPYPAWGFAPYPTRDQSLDPSSLRAASSRPALSPPQPAFGDNGEAGVGRRTILFTGLGRWDCRPKPCPGRRPGPRKGHCPLTLPRFALHQAASRFRRRRPPSATTAKRELDGERFSLRGWDVGTAVPNPARGAAPDPARGIAP